jgi:hypothetical protein
VVLARCGGGDRSRSAVSPFCGPATFLRTIAVNGSTQRRFAPRHRRTRYAPAKRPRIPGPAAHLVMRSDGLTSRWTLPLPGPRRADQQCGGAPVP